MKNAWDRSFASTIKDPLDMRVYTSRLLGSEEDLVMHGGGNTSVKVRETNIFGEEEEILYVKGSGWDLATIEAAGFAPVRMQTLLKLAELPHLTDSEMVRNQRMAMTNPSAPNPSVEAILHAIIPFTYVDHTHADAVVALSNTPAGEELIREVYGDRVLVVPYVMPGFILARKIYEMTRGFDWSSVDGMVLLHHGIFTFADDARESYDKMIELVSLAENYFNQKGVSDLPEDKPEQTDLLRMASIRQYVSELAGMPMLARIDDNPVQAAFARRPDAGELVSRGPLTPDHIIRTKRTAAVIGDGDVSAYLDKFASEYKDYFSRHSKDETMLDPAPRWALLKNTGTAAFGPSPKHLRIIEDIIRHTVKAISMAEALGGWKALPEKDLFEMEYWELEQAKLKKAGKPLPMQGKVALVTGAGSGIGKACVASLVSRGAAVAALDIDGEAVAALNGSNVLGMKCDVTNDEEVSACIRKVIRNFGGIDMLVSNAGIFPPSRTIEEMNEETWNRSIELNLSSHRRILSKLIPFLKIGFSPTVIFVGSKNVPAPGPGASAYSVAKAGLAQLARVAALELGKFGIRVNTVHPNAVYDTAIWTDEVLEARAKHYGLTVEEYRTNNVLRTEVTSHDVAELVASMSGSPFLKTTGAEIPIDGGNERVI